MIGVRGATKAAFPTPTRVVRGLRFVAPADDPAGTAYYFSAWLALCEIENSL